MCILYFMKAGKQMLGTIVNAVTIIIGAAIGLLLKKGIKHSMQATIMDGLGLAVIIIGITGAIKSENIILVIVSLVLGSMLGEAIDIEDKLEKLGQFVQNKMNSNDQNLAKGFVTASLVYCVGAMAIVGSLEAGIQGNYETLFAKSMLDGISAIIFASTLGIGVAFSSVPVFLYQGSITLLANVVKDVFTAPLVTELSAIGGVLIIAIGINLLGLKKIKVGNMLPAILVPIIYFLIKGFF